MSKLTLTLHYQTFNVRLQIVFLTRTYQESAASIQVNYRWVKHGIGDKRCYFFRFRLVRLARFD